MGEIVLLDERQMLFMESCFFCISINEVFISRDTLEMLLLTFIILSMIISNDNEIRSPIHVLFFAVLLMFSTIYLLIIDNQSNVRSLKPIKISCVLRAFFEKSSILFIK